MKHMRLALVLMLALVSGAAPMENPDASLRAGDAAATSGDFKTAVDKFDMALKQTTDPAPAAFNLAVAHLRRALTLPGPATSPQRKKELLEAESLFASFTGESNKSDLDKRRTLALYGLGVCRLQQAEAGDHSAALAAVESLRACLQDTAMEPALREEVRHNLARARLLSWQLTPPPPASDPDGQQGNGNDPQRKDPNDSTKEPATSNNPDPKPGDLSATPPDGGDPKNAKDRKAHGPSSLPTIPDDVEPTPLTPEEAALYLEKAARAMRIEREKHHPQESAKETPKGVRDW